MNWFERLKLRWTLRGSTTAPLTPSMLPTTEQQAVETAEAKFKREHGFSAATDPLPWGEDISKHNKQVEEEYRAEILQRQELMQYGMYKPRFLDPDLPPWRLNEIRAGARPLVAEVNWHLEMSASPGRRQDVTKDPGVPMQPILTPVQQHEARMAGALGREIAAIEKGKNPSIRTPRDLIGSRLSIVDACRGSEEMADQVEESARKMFGVEDLDAPLPEMKDA